MTLMPIHIFVGVNIKMDLFVLLQMTIFIDFKSSVDSAGTE